MRNSNVSLAWIDAKYAIIKSINTWNNNCNAAKTTPKKFTDIIVCDTNAKLLRICAFFLKILAKTQDKNDTETKQKQKHFMVVNKDTG